MFSFDMRESSLQRSEAVVLEYVGLYSCIVRICIFMLAFF